MKHYIVTRTVPKRSWRWQQPGYVAVVLAPDDWDVTRPLSPNCLKKDKAEVVATFGFRDNRYTGPKSSYGTALADARQFLELDRLRSGGIVST